MASRPAGSASTFSRCEGSHRLPEYLFSGAYKHWSPERDGSEQHDEWARRLRTESERMGLPLRTFLPKKGDVLLWSADLAHGGASVVDRTATRRSLVGHYCPATSSPTTTRTGRSGGPR